jgi:hypothetical protein
LLSRIPLAAQAEERLTDILIEVRDQGGAPLTGYLMFRPKPPDLNSLAILGADGAAKAYYNYFKDVKSTANFLLRGEEAPLLLDGILGINQVEI